MSATRAVIFDLDGTLVDSLRDLADSVNAVLESEGWPTHPLEAYKTFVGDGAGNLVKRALPPEWHTRAQTEPGYLDRCVRAMREEYERRWAVHTVVYHGIPELLAELRERGLRLGVLTNKPHDFAVRVVEHFLGRQTFDGVMGATPDIPHKPDPAGARELMRRLGASAPTVLYVGDSSTDMDTALAAGLISVGVLWGFRTREELLEHGAHHIIEKPRELLRHLQPAHGHGAGHSP